MNAQEFINRLSQFRRDGKPVSWIKKEFSDMEEAIHFISELNKAKNGEPSIYNGGRVTTDEKGVYFGIVLPHNNGIFKAEYKFFEELLKEIESLRPQQKNPEKSFTQFLININDKEAFAEKLKQEFSTEKGLNIRYMIEGLRQLQLITYGNREKNALYLSIKKYFNRYIGTKTGIFDKQDLENHNIDSAISRIKPLISNH